MAMIHFLALHYLKVKFDNTALMAMCRYDNTSIIAQPVAKHARCFSPVATLLSILSLLIV